MEFEELRLIRASRSWRRLTRCVMSSRTRGGVFCHSSSVRRKFFGRSSMEPFPEVACHRINKPALGLAVIDVAVSPLGRAMGSNALLTLAHGALSEMQQNVQ